MRDVDAFEAAYGRLSATRLAAPPAAEPRPGVREPAAGRPAPRSRLLARLALMAPTRRCLRGLDG